MSDFFKTDFFANMAEEHLMFAAMGTDGKIIDSLAKMIENDVMNSSPADKRGFLKNHLEGRFCMDPEVFAKVLDDYNALDGPDISVEPVIEMHKAGHEAQKALCGRLFEEGNDASMPPLDNNGGGVMKPGGG